MRVVEQLYRSGIVLFVTMALAACAAGPRLVPVDASTPGTDVGWASVPPPQGAAWYVAESRKGLTVYAKKITPKHSFVATVITHTISNCCANAEELLIFARSRQEENRKDKRYRFVTQEAEVTSWNGFSCVLHRMVAVDQGSPLFPGESLNFFQKGISCLRPGSSGEVIDLTYSERSGPPEGSSELVREGDSFLKGLKHP